MLYKTRGIVLNNIDYSDKYFLSHIYTEHFGRVSYTVSKSRSRNSKIHRGLFSPLSLLEMEVDHQASRSIQRIKECRIDFIRTSIGKDMIKSSIVLFLSEFLSRILKDDTNPAMFDYLKHSIEVLEYSKQSVSNYHLVFMLKLTRFMGFYPNLETYKKGAMFDLINGEFVSYQPVHRHCIDKEESEVLSRLARISYSNMHLFKFSRNDRIFIIDKMLEYYRIHLNEFPALKSLDVLHELF